MLPDLPWFVYAMLLAPVGLIVVAAVYKTLEARAAADWPSAPGKVVVSKSEMRKVKVLDSDREDGHRFEERNFANITYEYSVAGQTYRNNRVSIGEDRGNFEVAETIARYPAGKDVTVYYNPNKRGEAVLERDMPKGLWGCIGWMVVIAVVLVFGSAIGLHKITDFVSTKLVHPEMSGMTVALGAFGAAIALFALAMHRQVALARKWPVVKGRIKTSGLEEFRGAMTEDRQRGSIMFKSKILYTYRYENNDYTGIVAAMGGETSSTSEGAVRAFAKKYKDGQIVDVYVNPQNPSHAVLEPRVTGAWIMWASVIVIWGIAYYAAIKG